MIYSLYEKYLIFVENGLQPERLIPAGGGASSRLWMQIVADVFGLPVLKVGVDEQSAYGAALLAGAGLGLLDAAQGAQNWVKYDVQFEPDMKAHAQYQELLIIYREVCQNTRDISE